MVEGDCPDDVVALVVADELDADRPGRDALPARPRRPRASCCWCRAWTTGACSPRPRPASPAWSAAAEATAGNLAAAIRSAAAGEGTLPPDLLGRLLRQVGQLQRQVLSPRGLTFSGLTEREAAVVRLLAEGFDTAEVGQRLFYSERTVKNIIHDMTSRLELRNRTHAVAYAIREGLI